MDTVAFVERVQKKTATIGVVGLGYVGLPLVFTFAKKQFKVIGIDIDAEKVRMLNAGQSYIRHIKNDPIQKYVGEKFFFPTTDFSKAKECDALLICVPTPLGQHREPDMSFIENTAKALAPYLREGQLVSLESTTYPGTTDELLRSILEKGSGLVAGKDFYLAFSPEREDPGNPNFDTQRIPKVVGGLTPACLEVAVAVYRAALDKIVPVSSTRVAEMTKLLENIFRCVNIALVNELKTVCEKMGIDIWEVIEAASTKPFGFMPFYPGPGLGGHCIPIDPFYLTWKAHEYEVNTRFIELAGEVNTAMPSYVIDRTIEALSRRGKALAGAKVLVLGVAYKKDIDDLRESPALRIIELLHHRGATVTFHDPFVLQTPVLPGFSAGLNSVPLTDAELSGADAVVIVTDHTAIDYSRVVQHAKVVVDTRNATRQVTAAREKIFKA